jgi:hypothetical protein
MAWDIATEREPLSPEDAHSLRPLSSGLADRRRMRILVESARQGTLTEWKAAEG